MKYKNIVILILSCSLFCCCKVSHTSKQLEKIDTLIYKNQTDSAKALLLLIDTLYLSKEQEAHYDLLDMEIKHKARTPKKLYSGIDKSITYYEKHENLNRLSRCYYAKGGSLLDEGKKDEGTYWLKKAEEIATKTEDAVLLYYINSNLAYVNHVSSNFRNALLYSKRALYYSYKTGHKDKIGHAYDAIAASFQTLAKPDSALFYSNKALYYAKYINDHLKNNLLNNAAIIYGQAGNTEKAKELLKQSLAFRPNANAYGNLAQTYSEEGKDDSSSLLWAKALETDNLRQKISFMKSYAKWLRRNGRHEEASATAIKVAELKDTLTLQQQAEAIKDIQDQYDRKVKETESQRWIIIFLSITTVMLIAAIVLVWKYMRTWRREQLAKKEIADNRMMIADYSALIDKMKNSGKEKSAEIKKLQSKLDTLQEKQTEILYKGKTLYKEIMDGSTTAKWNKEMFSWFVEYYRTLNLPFVRHLEQDYSSLSYMNQTFLILYEMGNTEQDISRIMSMEPGAIRTMKSRINRKMRK